MKASFSAAHNLENYRGKCEMLHGHNWNVEAVFRYESVGSNGIAIDFKKAKGILKEATEKLDHSYLNKLKFLKDINPTSENIAKLLYGRMKKKNKNLKSISVWENENSCATYTED